MKCDDQIVQIECDALIPYRNHNFALYSGERLEDMVESVKKNGVLAPLIVQPLEDKFEILVGHNRWNAAIIAGLKSVPAVVKYNLSEKEAQMYVIESNLLQRGFSDLKISEQAAVISMRYEEMFSQGKRNDIVSELNVIEHIEAKELSNLSERRKHSSREEVGAEYGLSKSSVARLLRIDHLIDEIKPLVDDGTISIRAAVNVSYLDRDVQIKLIKFAKIYKLDIQKSEQLRSYAANHDLSQLVMVKILRGDFLNEENTHKKSITLDEEVYSKYFDKTKPEEVSETIEKALRFYFEHKI